MNDSGKNSSGQSLVFITGKMHQGGAEKVLSVLANHYDNLGYRVTIVTLLATGTYFKLNDSVELISLEKESGQTFANVFRWIREIREVVIARRPSTVLSFFAKINVISVIATRGLGVNVVLSERNDPTSDGRPKPVDIATKLFYPLADSIVFQTTRARSHFGKAIKRKSRIIQNPIYVQAEPVAFEKRNASRVVTVGRLDEQKNQKMLIKAFKHLHDSHPSARLDIYGEGPLRSELEALIDQMRLEGIVTLRGSVPDVHEQIKSAAVFILTSNFEGLSNALMEALSLGLPCISTDCAGSGDLIANESNGLIVPIGDLEAVEQALDNLLSDAELRKELGDRALKSSRRFSPDVIIPQWDSLLLKTGGTVCE